MTPAARWLDTLWPLIRARLPAAPARVVEVGCGPLGGFVPMLRASGYDAVGIDPQAPEQPHYQRLEFERAAPPLLRAGTYLEPFALRALGAVREDELLIEQAIDRFNAMGLIWHAEQSRKLLAPT